LSPILFNVDSEYLTKEVLVGFGDFKTGGQVIRTVKYVDDLVLLAREETVLQGMIDRLIETERRYGMEMNVEKETKIMRISRQPSCRKTGYRMKRLRTCRKTDYRIK
jgi:hypothetical protein